MNFRTSPATYSARVIHGEYFPHIDGIRALAVIPVVLYHVLASLCPGGFAGVDVFFVISGYLITGGILRDLEKERFTIRNFYYRRIRRIMPAYFAMIAGVFAVGCALYYAAPLVMLGDAVTAGTLFVANLHFWMLDGDYFAPNLHSQALLHLWSLSVEEQFYLFIPLLCAIIWKFRRSMVAPVLALLALLSLAGAIYAVLHGKQNNAFYFLHFRAWELLAGSLLAMLPATTSTVAENVSQHPQTTSNPVFSQTQTFKQFLLAPLGLLLVALTYVCISAKTPFPGLAALPPVVGTALLIRYGRSGWVSRLLACRPFVAAGKISYSLYLWHWPVTVFWKYAVYDQLYAYDCLGMFLLSLLLGYLSWKFVELPVRTSTFWTLRRSFAFAASGIVLLVALGTACVCGKGWPTVLHPKANEVACTSEIRDPFLAARTFGVVRRIGLAIGYDFKFVTRCSRTVMEGGGDGSSMIGSSGQPQVFLLGDSHAGSLRYGLDYILQEKKLTGYAVSCSSIDMFNLSLPESQAALKKLAEWPQATRVVLAEMWTRSLARQDRPHDHVYTRLAEFALRVKAMNKTLFIATDIADFPHLAQDVEAQSRIVGAPRRIGIVQTSRQQSGADYDRRQGEINRNLEEVCRKTGAILLPLHLALKQDDRYVSCDVQDGHFVALYRDTNHLSMEGSLRAAQFIMSYLFPELSSPNQSPPASSK